MKGWIERSLLDLQNLVRNLLDALRNSPSMLRFQSECLQDQKIQRSLREINSCHFRKDPFHFYRNNDSIQILL